MTKDEMIAEIVSHTKHIQETGKTYEAFEIVQTKWYARILFELCKKSPSRFGELKRELSPISNVVLTSALRALEEKKLIVREQYNEIPPHVEYALTERGSNMLPIFYEMIRWEQSNPNIDTEQA